MEGEEEEEKRHIIIDNGTRYIKAGLSGEEFPTAVFPTCIGYRKYTSGMVGGDKKEFFVGALAKSMKGVLKLNYPMEHGVVNNWDDMENIWGHIFTNELRVAPEEHNVMLTEAPMNPKENRKKMAQIMFETFNVPGLYIALESVLPIYSSYNLTGLSVDLGDSNSYVVPIFEGYSLPHAVLRLDLAGRDLTEFMLKYLIETGQSTNPFQKLNLGYDDIKEKSCYVALDFEEELKSVKPFDYEVPYGTEYKRIRCKDIRIRCPEALFKPNMLGKEGNGIGQICCDSIQKCDIDIRKDLYNCIVLSGGTSMYKGLPERLTKEIKTLAPESMKDEVKVISPVERKFAVWIGGSILSSISTFESMWITKTEYEESGETIVHRKCF